MPQGVDPDVDAEALVAALLELGQRQIGLSDKPVTQSPIMFFQTGAAVSANLFGLALTGQAMLLPKPFHTFSTHPKASADFASAFTSFPSCNDALP